MENKATEHRIYPAVFHKEGDGRYSVEFPDLGCATCGDTLEEAYKMAKDALALWLDDCEPAVPTPLESIAVENGDRAMLVEADSGDGILYFKHSEAPRLIEKGLEKKGYTKYRMAQILGVDRAYISRIARGDRVPSVGMAKRIGALLGFDWRLFYEGDQGLSYGEIAYLAVFEPMEKGYNVYFPDLPGCTSFGKTYGQAQKQAGIALALYLYGLEKDGEKIPAPSKQPNIDPETAEGYLVASVFADKRTLAKKRSER